MTQHHLAKEGIIAVRRIKESDMTILAKAAGARMVTNTDELSKDDIGLADVIEDARLKVTSRYSLKVARTQNQLPS
jgi:chaperonin GroEL (HSP60 family)